MLWPLSSALPVSLTGGQHPVGVQLCPALGPLEQHPWVLQTVALTVSVLAVIRIPLLGGGSCAACCRTSGKGRR